MGFSDKITQYDNMSLLHQWDFKFHIMLLEINFNLHDGKYDKNKSDLYSKNEMIRIASVL